MTKLTQSREIPSLARRWRHGGGGHVPGRVGRSEPGFCFFETFLPPLGPLPQDIVAALSKRTSKGSRSIRDARRREESTEINESLAVSPEEM